MKNIYLAIATIAAAGSMAACIVVPRPVQQQSCDGVVGNYASNLNVDVEYGNSFAEDVINQRVYDSRFVIDNVFDTFCSDYNTAFCGGIVDFTGCKDGSCDALISSDAVSPVLDCSYIACDGTEVHFNQQFNLEAGFYREGCNLAGQIIPQDITGNVELSSPKLSDINDAKTGLIINVSKNGKSLIVKQRAKASKKATAEAIKAYQDNKAKLVSHSG